jgi:hypothetical protein
VKRLDEAGEIEMGFPHDLYNIEHVRNIVYGGMRNRILALINSGAETTRKASLRLATSGSRTVTNT